MTEIKLTDSMATIQSKLNKGGEIVFQQGTYKITKQLILKAGSTIRLNGSTLRRNANIQSIFLNSVSATTKKYKGAGNISIIGGTLEGMGAYSADNLLTFFHGHDILVQGVRFLDTRCHAIEINSCKYVTVVDCKFCGSNVEKSYQEMIQIDTAYAMGFFLSGSTKKSACYDGTVCEHITIENCTFDKSQYRKRPTACIGTHTQIKDGARHKDIKILHNTFNCDGMGNCLSLIGMEDVQVYSNYFYGCGRIARVYSKDESYNLQGDKVIPGKMDGVCMDIYFKDNVEGEASGEYKCSGIYAKAVNMPHNNIVVSSNTFEKFNDNEKYYLVAENCVNVTAEKNRTKLKKKIS